MEALERFTVAYFGDGRLAIAAAIGGLALLALLDLVLWIYWNWRRYRG